MGDIIERTEALYDDTCPDCQSEDGYWQRGCVAEFDYVCRNCRGIFDGVSTRKRSEKPARNGGEGDG